MLPHVGQKHSHLLSLERSCSARTFLNWAYWAGNVKGVCAILYYDNMLFTSSTVKAVP